MIAQELGEAFARANYAHFKVLTKQANVNLAYFKKLKEMLSSDVSSARKTTQRRNRTFDVEPASETKRSNPRFIISSEKSTKMNRTMLKQNSAQKLALYTADMNRVRGGSSSRVEQSRLLDATHSGIIKDHTIDVKSTKMKYLYYRLQKCVRPQKLKFEAHQPANANHTFRKLHEYSVSLKKMSMIRDLSVSKLEK